MSHWISITKPIAFCTLAALCFPFLAQAKKPDNPGGGNGGGDEPAPTATLIRLSSSSGSVESITDTIDGQIEAVGILYGAGIPMYWIVDSSGAVAQVQLPSLASNAVTVSFSINNDGMIVGGEHNLDTDTYYPLLWTSALAAEPLALPTPEGVYAIARGINDDGLVVGTWWYAAGELSQGVIAWKVEKAEGNAIVKDVLFLETGRARWARISRSAGYVVYTAITVDGDRACRLEIAADGEQIFEVPNSRTQLFDVWSTATGVNNLGTVIGEATGSHDGVFAITFSGDLLPIPSLPGGRQKGTRYAWTYTSAHAVNDADELLLSALALPIWDQAAVLAKPAETATDLRDLNADFGFPARDINNAGWIACQALDSNGEANLPAVLILPE